VPPVAHDVVRLSVVIPALNEADRLPATLERVAGHLAADRRWAPAELIVVDDGSVDDTVRLAESQTLPGDLELVVVSHPTNLGKGAAVRTGWARARGDRVLLTDADLSAPIGDIELLAGHVDSRTMAVGSRAVDRRLVSPRQPWYRDGMGRCFNLLVRGLGLTRVRDTQCGFKLLPGSLARALAARMRVDGFAFDVEALLLTRLWRFEVEEVAVHWGHVEASRVLPGRHSLQMLRDVLWLWLRWRLGTLPGPPEEARGPRAL